MKSLQDLEVIAVPSRYDGNGQVFAGTSVLLDTTKGTEDEYKSIYNSSVDDGSTL